VIAVSDTSPLCYLALLGEIDLLAALFDQVLVPPGVAKELTTQGAPLDVRSWFEARSLWLLLTDLPRAARKMARNLGHRIMGTLAVLELASRRGHVDLPTALARLVKTNFRASPELLRRLLSRE
jgi:predicted nucleic acid-binding protein